MQRIVSRNPAIDRLAAGAALCAVPLSIAVSEIFLAVALVSRLVCLARRRERFAVPRVYWFWMVWAALEVVVWLHSPDRSAGIGEMRHLLLIAALLVTLPCLNRPAERMRVWLFILATGTIGSGALVVDFIARLARYHRELAAGGDPAFYLRSGGLLHHWMVYGTVEVMVFAALLEFRQAHGHRHRWLTPALMVHCLAILLSLTRSLWFACLIVCAIHLVWRRSKWLWAIPIAPAVVFLLAPGPIHQRVTDSLQSDYYSNTERLEMWRVGWRMIRQYPIFGVGPGRVEQLYPQYLRPGELLPSYHGHLHNNAIQLAAQFGLVVLTAAIVFLALLVWDLARRCRRAPSAGERLLCRVGLLALAGFLIMGMTDYTYGHSLGLILLTYAAIPPFSSSVRSSTVSNRLLTTVDW